MIRRVATHTTLARARDTNLLVQQIQGQLEAHGLHVCPLQGGGDVHVHVQEPEGGGRDSYSVLSSLIIAS